MSDKALPHEEDIACRFGVHQSTVLDVAAAKIFLQCHSVQLL